MSLQCVQALAQASATGSIQGRVLNADNGMYLSRARVTIDGTSFETFTNDFGYYTLNEVPAGPATVRVIYTGQTAATAVVTVVAGTTATKDFTFSRERAGTVRPDGTVVLNPYVVSADRFKNAQEIAITEERYSPTIKNVVAAGTFGDIPDGNVGEFVKFIPGVQVDYGYSSGASNATDNNLTQISVRGFGPEMTAIMVDGVPLTNASPATLTRAIGIDMMSINNASRVEVIKVPTPDMPSNSPGGAINLITKSGFEYARPTLVFSVAVNANSENFSNPFKRTPGPANRATFKTLPAVDATYVIPFSAKMAIAVTGAWSKTFNENHDAKLDRFYETKDINTSSSYSVDLRPGGGPYVKVNGGGTTTTFQSIDGDPLNIANPLLWRFQVLDTPNMVTHSSGSLRFDWRPTASQRIAVGYSYGSTTTVDAQRRLQFNADKGYYMDWGADFVTTYNFIPKGTVVNGKALTSDFNPKATVAQTVTTRDREGATHTGYINYTYAKGPWTIDANANASRSRGSYRDQNNGHFSELETSLTAGQLFFKNIRDSIPGTIAISDRAGAPLDWTTLSNWAAPSIQAKSGETESMDQYVNFRFNVRRDLDFIPWKWTTVSAKTGYYREQHHEKKWGLGTGYRMTYYGPTLALSDYMDDGYAGITPGFGLPGQQWVSTYKLYQLWQAHPDYFNANSDADMGDNYASWVNQQKSITETSDQYYLMFNGRALKNRLNWLFGARQEIVTRKGYASKKDSAWNYVKNPDGTFYRDSAHPTGVTINSTSSDLFASTAAGTTLRSALTAAGISYPNHVITNGSSGGTYYEYQRLLQIPYYNMDGKITGKPTFTVSAAYDVTDNFNIRLSWNRAQAKPDFENGTLTPQGANQGITLTENSDPTAVPRGTVTISNPDLKPWIADSWDLQLAYYTPSGGKFAVTPYLKNTKNFHEVVTITSSDPSFDSVVESFGLNPQTFQDYTVKTTVNGVGTARTVGYELEANQDLRILGGWGRYFQVFASYSHQYVKQQQTTQLTAKPLAKTTASGGLSFATKRVRALVRGLYLEQKYNDSETTYTYNGDQYILASYFPKMVQLDLNIHYQLSNHYSLFLDARNFLNKARDTVRYDNTGIVPDWARHIERKEFGVTWYLGVNGTY